MSALGFCREKPLEAWTAGILAPRNLCLASCFCRDDGPVRLWNGAELHTGTELWGGLGAIEL